MTLTPRQIEILKLVSAGLLDKQIASKLGISTCTVRSHLRRIYLYNGLPNRTAAARYWLSMAQAQSQASDVGSESTPSFGHLA